MSASARKLHTTPHMGVFNVTGGGSLLLADLFTEPGASATMLAATTPYAETALTQLIGKNPHSASSVGTARALAMAAWQQARTLAPHEPELFGFGCTAALATNRSKRGSHRVHLAVQTLSATHTLSFYFDKTDTDRQREEQAIVGLGYLLLQEALGVALEIDADLNRLTPDVVRSEAPANWRALYKGNVKSTAVLGAATKPSLLLPGSFNPLHDGHIAMATHAAKRYGAEVAFELSVHNVDKPSIDYADLARRTKQFSESALENPTLWLTGLPTFVEKAREFPGAIFLVGADTVQRIGQEKYYDSADALRAAMAEMARLDIRFLVFGRTHDADFQTLAELDLPAALRTLCDGVSEQDFRLDLSSTELREALVPQ